MNKKEKDECLREIKMRGVYLAGEEANKNFKQVKEEISKEEKELRELEEVHTDIILMAMKAEEKLEVTISSLMELQVVIEHRKQNIEKKTLELNCLFYKSKIAAEYFDELEELVTLKARESNEELKVVYKFDIDEAGDK